MTPQQAGFKMPPEWQRHARCWMAWPCHAKTWANIGLPRARAAYARVINAIAQYEPVVLLVNPGDETEARKLCNADIEIVVLAINDSWTRDTGPTFLLNKEGQLGAVNWIHNAWGGNYQDFDLDNQIASAIINKTSAINFNPNIVMEGGSFHVDGQGTLLTTRECLLNKNRNPNLSQFDIETYLKSYLGCETIIWLNKGLIGDETDGHIDEIACFVSPGVILALVTEDKSDPNYELLQENLNILKKSKDAKGHAFQIHTVEQPPATYLNDERLTLSYINFYHANNGIVMPSFGHEVHDKNAYSLFTKLFPSYSITQIDALDVFAGGGGIHCITQQEPY